MEERALKILFIIPSFHIGGTNKVLLNIMSYMCNQHVCKVFSLLDDLDPLEIKKSNNVLTGRLCIPKMSIMNAFRLRDFRELCVSILFRLTKNLGIFSAQTLFFRRAANYLKIMKFDIVIGMEEGLSSVLASYVDAKARLAWIHCDYSRYLLLHNNPDEASIYRKFDSIVCVSHYTAKVFKHHYPEFAEKVIALHNPINTDSIYEKSNNANLTYTKDKETFFIISVGRLDPVKRYSSIPSIAAELLHKGYKIKWFIVGDGSERQRIEELIHEYNVVDQVILTGFLTNPYPLMKEADLHVILSESEACPTVIHESMLLSVPVISTNYPTAYEFIHSGRDGLIVPFEYIAETISSVISSPNARSSLIDGISGTPFDNNERYRRISKHIIDVFKKSICNDMCWNDADKLK